MTRPPLGKVCIELGLLDEAQVERVLVDMREHGQGRFGELAVGLNLLGEEDLARAVAHQFDLTRLSAERVARLEVPRDVLGLLPIALMRSRVLLPTYFDAERRTLSVVTSDPTDLPALQAAQRHARAHRLRIFVASRTALSSLIDRLLPARSSSETTSPLFEKRGPGSTVVLEDDVEIAAALRRIERAEGTRSEIVPDPEQVTTLLSAGVVERVLYRESLEESVSPYLPVWRKLRPGVRIASVRGYAPGNRAAVNHTRVRVFYQDLLLWILSAGETRNLHARQRMRERFQLATELGTELALTEERLEAVCLAALMADLADLGLAGRRSSMEGFRPFELPAELLQRLGAPWDVVGLYAAVERRLNRPNELSDDLDAELLLAVRTAVDGGTAGVMDARDLLPEATRFHPRVIDALSRVLERRVLRAQLLTAGRRRAVVVVALRDVVLLTDLERRLERAGFEVVASPAVDLALSRIRELRPSAVVVGDDLPEDGAVQILAEVRNDGMLADTPVFAAQLGHEALPRVFQELRADGALVPPHDLEELEARLRILVAAEERGGDRSPSATGDARLLPVHELVRVLTRSRQTAELRVAGQDDHGTAYVVEGELVSARLGRRTGNEAWEAIRVLAPARYAVAFRVRPSADDEAAGGD